MADDESVAAAAPHHVAAQHSVVAANRRVVESEVDAVAAGALKGADALAAVKRAEPRVEVEQPPLPRGAGELLGPWRLPCALQTTPRASRP